MGGARTGTRAGAPVRPLLRPFRGLRYDSTVAGPLDDLLAPPHTELDKAARHAVLSGSRYAVTHLERPEYRSAGDPPHGPAVLQWLRDGALTQDGPSFYVLSQTAGGVEHRFLLASLQVGPDFDDRTLAHEDTIPEALVARVDRLQQTAVDSEPVLVVDTSGGTVSEVLTNAGALGHVVLVGSARGWDVTVWRLTDARVLDELERGSAFDHVLIADGHHRFAAVRRMAETSGTDQELLVAVADDVAHPLDLVALHRVTPGHWADRIALAAGRVRRVEPSQARTVAGTLGGNEFLVVAGDDAFLVTGPDPGIGAWVDERLREYGVDPGRIRYVADPQQVWRSQGPWTGVFLPRPDVRSIMVWAASGRLLGRKTTSFRPKPLAGAVLRLR